MPTALPGRRPLPWRRLIRAMGRYARAQIRLWQVLRAGRMAEQIRPPS